MAVLPQRPAAGISIGVTKRAITQAKISREKGLRGSPFDGSCAKTSSIPQRTCKNELIGRLYKTISGCIKQRKIALFCGLLIFPNHTSNFGAPSTKISCKLRNFQPLTTKSIAVVLDFVEASVYLPCSVPRCFAHGRSRGHPRRPGRGRRLAALGFGLFARCHCEGVKTPWISINKVYKASPNAEMAKIRKGLKIPKHARNFGGRGTGI